MNNTHEIGATGEFPDGVVHETDEGELAFAVTANLSAGRVILQFGKPVAWMAMTPEQARGFAELLNRQSAILKDMEF